MQHSGFLDSLYLFFITRSTGEYAIIFAFILIPLILLIARAMARYSHASQVRKEQAFIQDQLYLSQQQLGTLDIQLGQDENRVAMSTILESIFDDHLLLRTSEYIAPTWIGQKGTFFFFVQKDKSRHFYKFTAEILSITKTHIEITRPTALQTGQKRTFYRIAPIQEAVRVVAVWLLPETQPLPRETTEIGQPFLSEIQKKDEKDEKKDTQENHESPKQNPDLRLSIEDISGSGVGLSIDRSLAYEYFKKGARVMCLLVYNATLDDDNEHLINFCCTGRITNLRDVKKSDKTVVGVEFTNWALLEKGVTAITWFSQQKASGIGPILQWVTKMDLERHKTPSL